jgi:hypothetical protein
LSCRHAFDFGVPRLFLGDERLDFLFDLGLQFEQAGAFVGEEAGGACAGVFAFAGQCGEAFEEVAAAVHPLAQLLGERARGAGIGRLDVLAEAGEQLGVEAVGLGHEALGDGMAAHAQGHDHAHVHARLAEGFDQGFFVAAARFADDSDAGVARAEFDSAGRGLRRCWAPRRCAGLGRRSSRVGAWQRPCREWCLVLSWFALPCSRVV